MMCHIESVVNWEKRSRYGYEWVVVLEVLVELSEEMSLVRAQALGILGKSPR